MMRSAFLSGRWELKYASSSGIQTSSTLTAWCRRRVRALVASRRRKGNQALSRERRVGGGRRPRLQSFRVDLLLAAKEVGKQLGRLRLAVEGLVAEQLPGRAGEDRDGLDRHQLLVPHGLDHGLADGCDTVPDPLELMLEIPRGDFRETLYDAHRRGQCRLRHRPPPLCRLGSWPTRIGAVHAFQTSRLRKLRTIQLCSSVPRQSGRTSSPIDAQALGAVGVAWPPLQAQPHG